MFHDRCWRCGYGTVHVVPMVRCPACGFDEIHHLYRDCGADCQYCKEAAVEASKARWQRKRGTADRHRL